MIFEPKAGGTSGFLGSWILEFWRWSGLGLFLFLHPVNKTLWQNFQRNEINISFKIHEFEKRKPKTKHVSIFCVEEISDNFDIWIFSNSAGKASGGHGKIEELGHCDGRLFFVKFWWNSECLVKSCADDNQWSWLFDLLQA